MMQGQKLWQVVVAMVWLYSAAQGLAQGNTASADRDDAKNSSAPSRQQSNLALKPGQPLRKDLWAFPAEFTAASGETAGTVRAQIAFAASDWKFVKFEAARGAGLKASAKPLKRQSQETDQRLELTVSAGAHVLKDGVIGTLQLQSLRPDGTPGAPAVRILSTAPPETQEVAAPSEQPFELPPEPPPNPGVTCFFFSH